MGKTAFSGPVYGAKALLATIRVSDISSGAGNGLSTNLASFVIPVGEDWYATEFAYHRQSTGSTGLELSIQDDSTKISSVTIGSSLADRTGYLTITPDGGEYQGKQMASGSTITFNVVQSSVAPPSSGVTLALYGYKRFVNSSAYEG